MGRATYHPVKKRFVVKAVKDGMSLKAASEKYDVPLHTIYGWTGKLNRTSPKSASGLPRQVKRLAKDAKMHETSLLPDCAEAEASEQPVVKDAVEVLAPTANRLMTTNADGSANTGVGLWPAVLPEKMAVGPDRLGRRRRRTFTTQDKLRILAEADQAVGPGAIGALLHREGLYSSALTHWRRQRMAGRLGSSAPSERVLKANTGEPLAAELAKLQKENAQLQSRLQRSEAIIELLQQLSDLLGRAQPRADDLSISYSKIDSH